ncbi:SAM-dependent methyltransferase [Actinomadura mexicana]|uniref:SAM-dependent methyltransferase n=1 Tax=Actinomadura mexicana TaxID=134959 RepID=UPI001C52E5D8
MGQCAAGTPATPRSSWCTPAPRSRAHREGRIICLDADILDPGAILGSGHLREPPDLSRPVALSLLAILHFIPDDAALHAAETGQLHVPVLRARRQGSGHRRRWAESAHRPAESGQCGTTDRFRGPWLPSTRQMTNRRPTFQASSVGAT